MSKIIQISDLEAPELKAFSAKNEVQLLRWYEPEPGIFIAETVKVIQRALNAGYQPISMLLEDRLIDGEAQEIINLVGEIPIYVASGNVLRSITGYELTRGALCAFRRKKLLSVKALISDCNTKRIVVMEDVTNPTNVGAIFRNAAALDIDAVILTKACSDPLYRRSARVSMGTVFQIPWTFASEDESLPSFLRKFGFKSVAMALKEDSISLKDPVLRTYDKIAIFMGNENEGLNESTINNCDHTICIPMTHGVDSLNVAAASAVAFWELGAK